MATHTTLPKVTQYVKNVGKSVAFASVDAIKSNAPGIKGFMEYHDDVFKEAYGSVRNYRQTIRKTERSIRQSNMFKAVEAGLKNMVEDAKTGNFYNDRTAEYANDALGLNDDDFDMEFSVSESSSAKSVTDSFNEAIGAAATSQSTAVAESTNLIVKGNIASTKLLMTGMDQMTARLSSSMGAVYAAVDKTNQFLNTAMVAHIENSRKYYETTTNIMREQQLMMKEMLEMQRNLYKAKDKEYKESRLSQSTRYDGSANIPGYLKNIKGNLTDMMDAYGLGSMKMDIGGGNPFMLYAAAPFKLIMEPLINRMMSKDFKTALRSFDKSVTNFFSQFVARMNKNRDSNTGLMAVLGELFGIRIDKKDSINTSNFAKGAVPFDGVTRQAIISVIPGYLARIEAALTGAGERHYDMQSGTWKSAKQIRKEFDDERKYSIASANNSLRMDIMPLVEELRASNAKAAEDLASTIGKMSEKIFDDGGDFSKAGDAWKYYGFKSKKEFDLVMSYVRNNTIKELAYNNMNARQNLTQRYRDIENGIGPQGILFNGSYDSTGTGNRSKMDPSKFGAGSGLLAASMDNQGRNVFWYLREILNSIQGRWRSSSKGTKPKTGGPSGTSGATHGSARSRESSTESEGDSTGESDPYASIYERLDKEAAEKADEKAKGKRFGDWLESKLGNSPVGKYFSKAITGAETILTKPMEYATKLLNKADESMFRMMFGENEFKDDEGNKIDNAFAYIAYKVKKTFDDITKSIKDKLNKWLSPYWEKYGKPVVSEIKNYVGKGVNRVKKAGNRLSGGRLFKNANIEERLENGDVVGTDEIVESAYGRVVTKRGLTMISPGEVIIPASFDKREQNKMLALEKKDKRRILESIGYNAKGTVNVDDLKEKLHTIYNENRGSAAKVGAGGVLGAGAGLLTGFNPLLGALAGAGISILDNSESFKKIMFGEEITNADGTTSRSGGVVPKKIYDIFQKAAPDMGDFGIAGGLIGLFTPFGPLGGAAIGAGVGLLKNSEGFKKFIFGDAETGKDGLISKETYDKFMDHAKKAAPNMLIGAGAGALVGPFGLLGNAAMGAGIGLLSSTETFHKFIFGDPDNPNENGIAGAFKTGVLEPAKEKINEILEGFKGYFKKNILDPMKNFWDPLKQTIKNTITGTSDKIKDYLNDMFERTIGIPMADFLQEKLFRPMTKLVFGILKAPIAVGKAIVAAPFRALGGIGNSMRMGQINRGTAYDMSASERLAFREQHSTRSFFGRLTGRDKMQEQDAMLANMSEEQLEALATNARVGLDSMETLQKRAGSARKAVGNEISAYFNSKGDDGKSRYSRVNFNKVKAIAKKAADGDFSGAEKDIMALKGLTDDEKTQLLNNIKDKVAIAERANKDIASKNRTSGELDVEVSELIGRKFRGRKDRRQVFRSAEAELAARRKGGAAAQESPEEHATNNLAELYKIRADKIIKLFGEANEKLSLIINPNKDAEDTTPPGDKDAAKKSNASVEQETKALMSGTKAGEGIDKASGNEDSKESVEARKKQEEQEQREQEETDETKKTNTILQTIQDKFFGGKKNKNKEGNGLLSKLGSAFGTFMKFIGVGAKFGLGAVALGGGVSLLGYATEWFKTSVWPTIKGALFGKTNDDGSTTTGLLGGLGDKMKNLFLGEDGKSGIFGKFTTWLGDKFEALKNWYTGQGGISGILTNVAAKMVVGWGYAINNIVTPLTAIVVKALPGLLLGLGKGILQGLKMAVFNKELPNQQGTMKIDASETLGELSQHNSSNNALVTAMGDMGTSVKNAFSTAASGAAYTAKSASEIDLSGIFSANTDNSVKAGGVGGLLGRTQRTNDVEYDENGNRITNYTQFNSTDSVLSRVGDASSRAFLRGLAGDAPVKGIGKALGGLKGKGIGTGFSKIFTGFGSNVGKYAGKGMTAASNLGTKLHDKILGVNVAEAAANAADDVAEAAGEKYVKNSAGRWIDKATGKFVKSEVAEAGMKAADDVVEAGAKAVGKSSLISKATGAISNAASKVADTGLAKGLKKIFSNLADSKIGTLIAKAAKSAGKAVDGTVVSKALLNIGESLAKAGAKTAGKAVSKIATAVAGFSPLALALMVKDFVVGYDQAYTILGVAVGGDYQVGFGQRCLCGLLNLINERITLGLIPTATIVDIIVEYLFPIFGLDAESLNAARDEAAAILDEWNAANPDEQYDNLEDFNNKDKWWKKAGNAIKDTAGKAWDGIKSGASKVGKGIATAAGKVKDGAVNLFNNAKSAVKNGFNAVSGKVTEVVGGAKDIGAFIKDVTKEVFKSATDPEYHWDIDSYITEDDPLGGAKKVIYQVMKIPLGIMGVVSNLGKKIFDKVKGFGVSIKDGFKDAWGQVTSVAKGQYSVFSKQYWTFKENEDEENPLSPVSKVFSSIVKYAGIVPGMLGYVGSKIKDGFVKMINGAKEGAQDATTDVNAVKSGQYTIFNRSYWKSDAMDDGNPLSKMGSIFSTITRIIRAPEAMLGYVGSKVKAGFNTLTAGMQEGTLDASADVEAVKSGQYTIFNGDYWKSNAMDDGNPISKLGSIFGFVSRLTQAPMAMLGYVGTKVKAGFNALISGAKEGILDASSDVDAVKSGQYTIFSGDYWHSDAEDDGNPVSKLGSIFGVVARLTQAPMAMLGYVGTKVKEGFTALISGAKEGVLDASEDIAAVVKGDYTIFSQEYWHANEEDDGNPLSKLGSIFGFATRLTQAPVAMLGYVGNKVAKFFTDMVNGVKDISEDTDAVIEKAKNGDISVFSNDYWKMNDTDNPLGLVGNVVGFLERLTNAPIVIFTKVFNKIKEKFDSIKGWFSKLFGEDAEEVDTESGSGRAGRGRRLYGRAHTYQNDPSIANMAYGDSTIGNAGCAPVAAVNLINRMSSSQAVNVADAARFAEQNNMTVRGGGTDINFFNQYLASHGIGSVKTSNRSAIKEALKAGSQVVMLGQDSSDAPGVPFGTNPHFVTATGIDKSGNIIVEDPDMPESNITYKGNDLLNSMVSSVVVQPGAKRAKRARRSGSSRKFNVPTAIKRGFGRLLYGLGGTYGAEKILSIARAEIGTAEKGNSNQVKYNHAYYGSNVSGSQYPWCCAFVWWVFNQAGASHIFYTNNAYDESHRLRHRTAYCPTLKNYHQSLGHNFGKNETPQPGDIVFFNWDGGTTPQHVGIVESVSGSNVITIEGNTSSSDNTNGGCVQRRTRQKSCIVGYSRPEYPYTYDSTHVVNMSELGNYSSTGGDDGSYAADSSSGSTAGTLLQQFTNLGTSMVKAIYGEDAYNAFFGNNSSDATATNLSYNSSNSSNITLSGNSQADQIWNYLTGSGGYSKNAAAGIMGCWHHESNNNSQRIEGDYLNGFPGYDTVVNSQSAMDSWTTNKLFPAYARSGVSINKAAYKGTDGHYYPGIGLAQWTGPRGYDLFQYSKQTGKNWGSLENQLAFFNSEMEQRGLKAQMNSTSSPEDAAHKFLDGYEMYNGYGASAPNALNPRKQAARTMYSKYSGAVGLGRRNMQNAYAKKYTQAGGATNALNSMSVYAGGAGTTYATTTADRIATSGVVDYATFLQTIVTILMSIADNTALLGKVLEVLSKNFNIEIDKSDIDAATSKTKAQTEAALNDLVRRSSGNITNVSKLLNNKDTEYVIAAMKAIASE